MQTAFRFRLRLRRFPSAYDLVKTRLSESEAEAEAPKPNTKRGNVHSDWLILPLLLPTPTIWFSLDHKRNVSDGVVSGVGRNGNVLILLTPIPSRLWLCLRLRLRVFNVWLIIIVIMPIHDGSWRFTSSSFSFLQDDSLSFVINKLNITVTVCKKRHICSVYY